MNFTENKYFLKKLSAYIANGVIVFLHWLCFDKTELYSIFGIVKALMLVMP